MGLTDRQILWRVELPLAIAGDHRRPADRDRQHGRDRDPAPSSPAAAGSATPIFESGINFTTNIIIAGGIAIADGARLRR